MFSNNAHTLHLPGKSYVLVLCYLVVNNGKFYALVPVSGLRHYKKKHINVEEFHRLIHLAITRY